MASIEENAFLLLDIIAQLSDSEWDKRKTALGPLGPRSQRLIELSGLSINDLNIALHWLYQRKAIEAIERIDPREEFYYRRVQRITPDGKIDVRTNERRERSSRFGKGEYYESSSGCRGTRSPQGVVVHGRNVRARDAMFDFLSSIGLQPLEWSQAKKATGKPSPSIPEILDTAFSIAQAVVVLFTPDEMAHLRKEFRGATDKDGDFEPTPQSRPNVLFEAGI